MDVKWILPLLKAANGKSPKSMDFPLQGEIICIISRDPMGSASHAQLMAPQKNGQNPNANIMARTQQHVIHCYPTLW